MTDSVFSQAISVFRAAKDSGVFDSKAFGHWRRNATRASWRRLEDAWQKEGCPAAFTWSILHQEVLTFAGTYDMDPLLVLGDFLYPPPQRTGAEGNWLDWQDNSVKKDIYDVAQAWVEKAKQSLENQTWMLLHLAIDSHQLDAWQQAPERCVAQLDWYKGMYALNFCDPARLTLAAISRVPSPTTEPMSWPNCMVQTAEAKWRNVSRCIELQAGPGLWVQYVMEGEPLRYTQRRQTTWTHLKLDGLDAWALEQYHAPSASFQDSFKTGRFDNVLAQHEAWAHQWWIECVLGMSKERAAELARNVHSPVCPQVPFVVDNDTLSSMLPDQGTVQS